MSRVIVIAGPSGSGKNTICNELIRRHPEFCRLITATTRPPRDGEIDGKDYHFFSQERFDAEQMAGNIPEHRYVPATNTYYGIFKPDVDRQLVSGKTVLATVDIVGAKYLKEQYGALTIFIMPESLAQFHARIKTRSHMSDHEFEARMKITDEEIRVHSPWYDYRVINADGALIETVNRVEQIIEDHF